MISPAKYILRLDDAHPHWNQDSWDRIFQLCLKFRIKPIVAVIPKNFDSALNFGPEDHDYWIKLRNLESVGFTIAQHGCFHLLRPSSSGLVPINSYSEFTDLPLSEQNLLVNEGHNFLLSQGLNPTVWISPAHGLDLNTLLAIRNNTSIDIISDGFSFRSFRKYGFNWIPQQLWRPRKMPFGVWTICLHPNDMRSCALLESFLEQNSKNFIEVSDLKFHKFSLLDSFFAFIFRFVLFLKRFRA